jgi:FO synthase
VKLSENQSEPSVAAVMDRARNNPSTLDRADAAVLLSARGRQLDQVLVMATAMRDAGLGRAERSGIITYSKKVFLPITKLCRDRCHYCVFVETPNRLTAKLEPLFMEPEEVLGLARQGAALGCKEALFTLGDRPEERWPEARQWLHQRGYESTLDYVQALAKLVLEETGILPHLNPGVMSWAEMQRLRPVAPSMGMMLETTSVRLWSEKGNPHYGSPDKEPAVRLRVLEDAGRSRIPFTTGLLIGIGETRAERAETIFAIRDANRLYGHVQEIIVQNFRAKDKTPMRANSDLGSEEYAAAIAVARLVMGPGARIQAPPNLSDIDELKLLVRAGIDDWGGVSPLTPDHVNPERPWPTLEELALRTEEAGFQLRERLTAHPEYVSDVLTWVDRRLHGHLSALADPSTGLANQDAVVKGMSLTAPGRGHWRGLSPSMASVLRKASNAPSSLDDSQYVKLLEADGQALELLCELADDIRRDSVGDDVSYVVNRNLDASLFSPDAAVLGQKILSPDTVLALVQEAHTLGATEICVQGAIREDLPGHSYSDLTKLIKSAGPDMHVHGFRPAEVIDGAARNQMTVREFLLELKNAGVDTVPGSGARILDDEIRRRLSEGMEIPVAAWIDSIRTAHTIGLRSTATMVYGHIESATQQLAHLRLLASILDDTGGFTEFSPMPFLPQ